MKAPSRSLLALALLLAVTWGGLSAWRAAQADRLGAGVAQRAQAGDIRMISSVHCRYCDQARDWFQAHRIPFEECVIERDAGCAEAYARLQSPGTPVLLVRETRVLGFSPSRIAQALR